MAEKKRGMNGEGGLKICTTFPKTDTSAGASEGELQKLAQGDGQKWKNYHYRKLFPPQTVDGAVSNH